MTTDTAAAESTTFTAREVPWMKIGRITEGALTAREAIAAGGLDFTVDLRPAGYRGLDHAWHEIPGRLAVVRDDTGAPFDFVSESYRPLQYADAFEFMDAVHPRYVAAGALRGGRQGFLVVKPDGLVDVSPGGDVVEMFVVLRTSHDRSQAVEVSVMPLRDKCMNQLTLRSFTRGVADRWAIAHTTTMAAKLEQVHNTLAQLDRYTAAFNALAERLMERRIVVAQAEAIAADAMRGFASPAVREAGAAEIVRLWRDDTERVGFNGTGWAIVNATSEFLEWRRRGRADNVEARFNAAVDGLTHRAINRATERVLALG